MPSPLPAPLSPLRERSTHLPFRSRAEESAIGAPRPRRRAVAPAATTPAFSRPPPPSSSFAPAMLRSPALGNATRQSARPPLSQRPREPASPAHTARFPQDTSSAASPRLTSPRLPSSRPASPRRVPPLSLIFSPLLPPLLRRALYGPHFFPPCPLPSLPPRPAPAPPRPTLCRPVRPQARERARGLPAARAAADRPCRSPLGKGCSRAGAREHVQKRLQCGGSTRKKSSTGEERRVRDFGVGMQTAARKRIEKRRGASLRALVSEGAPL